jgi:hypothetical protein
MYAIRADDGDAAVIQQSFKRFVLEGVDYGKSADSTVGLRSDGE